MADLIIKPSVGNLILKDDQNVTRVSIAPTTGVTTLSNQVFPAGHVLQVESTTYNGGDSDTFTSTSIVNASGTYNWKHNIDAVKSGNWVFITTTFNFNVYKGSTSLGGGAFIANGTNVASNIIFDCSTHSMQINASGSGTSDFYWINQMTLSFMHKSPAVGTNTYYLGLKPYSSSSVKIESTSADTPFTMTLMEIQR